MPYLLKSKVDPFERKAGYKSIDISRYDYQMFLDMRDLLVKDEGKLTTLAVQYKIVQREEYYRDFFVSTSFTQFLTYGFLLNINSPHFNHITGVVNNLHQVIIKQNKRSQRCNSCQSFFTICSTPVQYYFCMDPLSTPLHYLLSPCTHFSLYYTY